MSDDKKHAYVSKAMASDSIPRIHYDFYFRVLGMISRNVNQHLRSGGGVKRSGAGRISRMYCLLVHVMLWFFVIRTFVLMFIWSREVQVMLGDLTGYWNDYRIYYLLPQLFISIHVAITMSIWRSKEPALAWLVPFVSVHQMQMATRNNISLYSIFRPEKHRARILLGILFDTAIVLYVTGSVAWVHYETAVQNLDDETFRMWIPWLVVNILWYFYMTGITFLNMTYFNVITTMISQRFRSICKELEELAEKESSVPGSKNTTLMNLYADHNEACELVDEANTFWQAYTFFTYTSYIPLTCYALYNVFFADFDDLLRPVTWICFGHTIFLVGFVSVSAAKVSAQAHAPYTALHTLSLLQMPVDLEVNMSTFLHRIRGPTIGISCLDLFVVTNASISNTIAAVASYFLIVADFSRSTVTAAIASKALREAAEMRANASRTTTVMTTMTGETG